MLSTLRDGGSAGPAGTADTSRVWILLLGLIAPLTVFVLLGVGVWERDRFGWDGTVTRFIDRYLPDAPVVDGTDRLLGVAAFAIVALASALLVVLVVRRQTRYAIFWAAVIGGSLLLDPLLKAIFKRPSIEPSDGGYSFPSGTAMLSMAIIAAIVLCARRTHARMLLTALGAIVVLGFGLSIVAHSWHYPSDVLAGWCVALAWVTALWVAIVRPRQWASPGVSGSREASVAKTSSPR